jgi:hypothetical protein
MAIEDFMNGALRECAAGNYSVAMACICTVVDSLGKAEFGGRTRSRCLAFLDRYLDIITTVGFGGAIRANPGARLNVSDPMDPNKTKNVTEVVYDILRSSLIHEADLPFNVQFTQEAFYGKRDGNFLIPINFFYALFFASIASPSMAQKFIVNDIQITWRGAPCPVNQLMGDTVAVRSFLSL